MHPAKHLAASTLAALAVSRRRDFPWLAWASSILTDADHLAWHVIQTGDASPLRAWRFFTSEPEEGPKTPLPLHRYDVIVILWLAGHRIRPLGQVAAGLAFHRVMDDLTEIWHFGRRRWRQRNLDRLRAIVFGRERYHCQGCGMPSAALELHHRIPEHLGGPNHPDNLLALCHECHDRAHGRAVLVTEDS
ncbi:MAG: HNH endonuclease [Caldilineales bacterium]|nr:HNH endonuclease [Caldilineales bacterium]